MNGMLEVVAFSYPFSPETGSSVPSSTKRTQHRWILCAANGSGF